MDAKEKRLLVAALATDDYRSCLKAIFALSARSGRPNYSALTRKAGFSSRGFIADVVEGRRRLTPHSFPKMLKAVGSSGLLRQYLTRLVQLEEPELNHDALTFEQLQIKLKELRAKIQAKLALVEKVNVASELFRSQQILLVYASLGSSEPGTAVDEVSTRSGLLPTICESILEHLIRQGVVVSAAGRFRTTESTLLFEGLGDDHGFKASYLETLTELKRKASTRFNAQDQLFFQCFFSVNQHQLPELKRRMRDLAGEFVEENKAEGGDAVGRLLIGLYS